MNQVQQLLDLNNHTPYFVCWQFVSEDMAHLSMVSSVIKLTSFDTSIGSSILFSHLSSIVLEHWLNT